MVRPGCEEAPNCLRDDYMREMNFEKTTPFIGKIRESHACDFWPETIRGEVLHSVLCHDVMIG